MQTMTITISQEEGVQLYFKIQFESQNFLKIVEIVDTLTIDNVMNHELFNVI